MNAPSGLAGLNELIEAFEADLVHRPAFLDDDMVRFAVGLAVQFVDLHFLPPLHLQHWREPMGNLRVNHVHPWTLHFAQIFMATS